MKVAFKDKQILLYNKKSFYAYDGNKEWFINKQEIHDIYSNKTNYIIVYKDNNDICFEEEYEELLILAAKLKLESNNKLNLYRTGNYVTTALNLFDKYNKTIDTEKIDQLEAQYTSNSTCGAIIFSKPYIGEAYEYDIVSMYPSILTSSLLIPIKEGEYKYICNDEFKNKQFYAFGIYRCIINPTDDKTTNNLFRFNPKNYYTYIDNKRAKELK
jgi:hypothetical protein